MSEVSPDNLIETAIWLQSHMVESHVPLDISLKSQSCNVHCSHCPEYLGFFTNFPSAYSNLLVVV